MLVEPSPTCSLGPLVSYVCFLFVRFDGHVAILLGCPVSLVCVAHPCFRLM